MSLSTLLEAAKYLDYLDSNSQQQQLQFQSYQPPQANKKRGRSSKKNAMVATSLPNGPIHGVPIPQMSGENHQGTSLSSSFTTGSPLSSFASTALYCAQTSGITSASSSAASSLSSSDSSSSSGEILMGDNDFVAGSGRGNNQLSGDNNHHNYHLTHQQLEANHQLVNQQSSTPHFNNNSNNQSVARYIAATSNGPQLVTMTTSSASASAPIDGSLRAGHVIHAANNATILNAPSGTSFDSRSFSITTPKGIHHQQTLGTHESHVYNVAPSQFGSDNLMSGSPSSCPPLIMARVQPMILSPSTQSIMAFQPATGSSPTSSSSSYSRHRELHKTLEKNRRAHLRHCFELLKAELPASECVDKKTSHINIIKSAIRYVLALRQHEGEIENELQRLTKIKTELTENLSKLRSNQTQVEVSIEKQEQLQQQQQPPPEQQLSFLLSQSKID